MAFHFIRPTALLGLTVAAALAAGCQSMADTRASGTRDTTGMGAAGSGTTAGPGTTTPAGTKGTSTAPASSSAPATGGGGAGTPGTPAGGGAAPR